jgi:Zn-dependent oligopeptidase
MKNIPNQPNFYPKHIVITVQALIKEGLKAVNVAAKGKTWAEVVEPLDRFEFKFEQHISINSHLNAVMFSEVFNAEYEKTLLLVTNFYTEMSSNKKLYQAYKNLLETDLDEQQQHIITKHNCIKVRIYTNMLFKFKFKPVQRFNHLSPSFTFGSYIHHL